MGARVHRGTSSAEAHDAQVTFYTCALYEGTQEVAGLCEVKVEESHGSCSVVLRCVRPTNEVAEYLLWAVGVVCSGGHTT